MCFIFRGEILKNTNNFRIPTGRTPGVYAIINVTKQKCYIGETQDKEYRCRQHLCCLVNGKHSCKAMQKDFDAGDKFKVVYLRETKKYDTFNDERKILESYYYCCLKARGIKLYNSPKLHYADNFFVRVSRTDNNIISLVKNIKGK